MQREAVARCTGVNRPPANLHTPKPRPASRWPGIPGNKAPRFYPAGVSLGRLEKKRLTTCSPRRESTGGRSLCSSQSTTTISFASCKACTRHPITEFVSHRWCIVSDQGNACSTQESVVMEYILTQRRSSE